MRDRRVHAKGVQFFEIAYVRALRSQPQKSISTNHTTSPRRDASFTHCSPFQKTQRDGEERGCEEVPARVEVQPGEEHVFAEELKVQVVLPSVHLHRFLWLLSVGSEGGWAAER